MKIAISSSGKDVDGDVSNVFGRCPYFIIATIENNELKDYNYVKNEAMNQRGGAGTAAAQLIAEEDAKAVISTNIGPHAYDVLERLEIQMYKAKGKSIKENIDLFIQDNLEKITEARSGRGRNR